MQSFLLKPDGTLPRDCISKYGRELTSKERIKSRVYGIGFFKPLPKEENILSEWFKQTNNTVRPHLDQLKSGLIFRLTRTNEMNVLVIHFDEIKKVTLIKSPDHISTFPLSPFRILTKVGLSPRLARHFSPFRNEFSFGDIEVEIIFHYSPNFILIWNGRFLSQLTSFFKYALSERTEIIQINN